MDYSIASISYCIILFLVARLHLRNWLSKLDHLRDENRKIRFLLHGIMVAGCNLGMIQLTVMEIVSRESGIERDLIREDTPGTAEAYRELKVITLNVTCVFCGSLMGILIILLVERYGYHDMISQRLAIMRTACQDYCGQIYESLVEKLETRFEQVLGLLIQVSDILIQVLGQVIWKKFEHSYQTITAVLLGQKAIRLFQLVLYLLCFGQQTITMSLISLVYGTWDDYLSQTKVGEKIEEVHQDCWERTKTKLCESYFKVPDGLEPENDYAIHNIEFNGFGILRLDIVTRVVPDSDPEGIRRITLFDGLAGLLEFEGEWFPLPSALAG